MTNVKSVISTKDLLSQIKTRKEELHGVAEKLKKDFVGLDLIIDKIIKSVSAWYILPELITRPTLVNLWGLTGVGKTDLVRKFVKYISLTDQFVEIQMTNKGYGSSYHKTIKGVLDYSSLDTDSPGVLLLDEIQRFRTVDEKGLEIHDYKFQDVWMLLSDGKFSGEFDTKMEIMRLMLNDDYWDERRTINEQNADEEKNTPVTSLGECDDIVPVTDDIIPDSNVESKKKEKIIPVFHRGYYDAMQIKKLLKRKESIQDIMKWTNDKKKSILYDATLSSEICEGENYSNLLIFISGNLDEAYTMSNNTGDVDIDADVFHDHSTRINITTIKESLRTRFKPEQIARFGNTHIIYPSLSKKSYEEIIIRKTNEVLEGVHEKSEINITLEKSVLEYIYRNGVFPAQGTRPLFSTIASDFETILPNILVKAIELEETNLTISYVIKDNSYNAKFEKSKEIMQLQCKGVIDEIKEDVSVDRIALSACHEAGHAVVYAILHKLAPTQIIANSSSDNSSGFIGCHSFCGSKKQTLDNVTTLMAGKEAEEMVFGKEIVTSGSSNDIWMATQKVAFMMRKYGMYQYSSTTIDPNSAFGSHPEFYNYDDDMTNDIDEIIETQAEKANKILVENKDFFKQVVKLLIEKSEIKSSDFVNVAKNFGFDIKEVSAKKEIYLNYTDRYEDWLKDE